MSNQNVVLIADRPHGDRVDRELRGFGHDVTYVQDERGHALAAIHPGADWVLAMNYHSEPDRIREKARLCGARFVFLPLGWAKSMVKLRDEGFPLTATLDLIEREAEPAPLAMVPDVTPAAFAGPGMFMFEAHAVRVAGTAEEPRFVVADVCAALELGRTNDAVSGLDADEKGTDTIRTPGGPQEMLTVTEPGLYALLARSRKPAAKRFDRWVRHEVLPSIRRTGAYSAAPVPETRAQLMARALLAANEELTETRQALALAAPKAAAYDAFLDTTSTCCITEGMKAIGRKPNKGHAWLESEGHIFRRGKSVLARQDHLDAGRMVQRSVTVGEERITQTRLTAKGLAYFDERCPREFPEAA